MQYTAYLLGFIDTSKVPPKFAGMQIFSERCPTVHLKYYRFCILEISGETYEEAKKGLVKCIYAFPWIYDWCKPYLDNTLELDA